VHFLFDIGRYFKFRKKSNESILSVKLMKKWSLHVVNKYFEEILRLKVAIIADSL